MPRGGKRPGAGRKSWGGKFGEETKTVRVPISVADRLPELIQVLDSKQINNSSELRDKLQCLLTKWDTKTYCDEYSKNPRKRLARELWLELKSFLD